MHDKIRELDFDTYLSTIRNFTRTQLVPIECEVDDSGIIPDEIVGEMRALGLFGITLPRKYGGLEWTMAEQVRLTFEFTQTLGVFRSRFSTTIGLASQMLLDHGTEEQKDAYLPAMANGECIGCAAVTEPGAGSDAGAVETTAERRGGGYVINGRKRFITNASIADVMLVLARTDSAIPGAKGTSMFVVPADTPGIEVVAAPLDQMLSWRGSPTCEITFTDVRVPASALLGGAEGEGLEAALRGFNHARTHIAATAVGQSIRLLDESLLHATTRRQFGRPLANFQLIAGMLADIQTDVWAGRAMILDAAGQFDAGPIPLTEIAAAKYFCSEMSGRVADRAVQILGGTGIVGNGIVTRLFRDVRVLRVGEGASQVLQQQIARRIGQTSAQGVAS
ncbi:acyl-CoA dehydrogenase family protein [Rhodococcus opacus]|uniref:Acyl-CoA dehydrogenase n=1 Tax=Rhodococcus opacus TaxID=37919 RepID=A0A076EJA1_RHOOP|nr:acyl-CoA dehydrogenase family protein [Rhodococcus opacus]AII05756.1 hypothetical protein EP51_14600 [Rhodococcus opacus]